MKVIGNKFIAEIYRPEKKTEGGIIIPDSVDHSTSVKATVAAVGDTSKVPLGSTVHFSKHVGKLIDKNMILLSDDEIWYYE